MKTTIETGRVAATWAVLALAGSLVLAGGCSKVETATKPPVEVIAKAIDTPVKAEHYQDYIAPLTGGTEAERVRGSVGRFSVKLLEGMLAQDPKANVSVSPFLAFAALGMIGGGAGGSTEKQIHEAFVTKPLKKGEQDDTLVFSGAATFKPKTTPLTPAEADKGHADLTYWMSRKAQSPSMQLAMGDSLWVATGTKVEKSFIAHDRDFYGAGVGSADLGSPATLAEMNRWASDKTGGRVPKLVDKVDAKSAAIVLNTFYFSDMWTYPFPKAGTAPRAFTTSAGEKVEVPTMHEDLVTEYLDGPVFESLQLHTQSETTMWIYVPKPGKTTNDVLAELARRRAEDGFTGVGDAFTTHKGELFLPKFDLNWHGDISKAVAGTGITDVFDPAKADLSGMSKSRKLWIAGLFQGTKTGVNEAGVDAAKAGPEQPAGGQNGMNPKPFKIVADHPFVFEIAMGRVPVLAGVVNDPR